MTDAIELARKVGTSLAGEIGARAFEEMELCYASRLLPQFGDNPTMRMRQNLLLYWDQSYMKTTLINAFSETIPPQLKHIDITRMSVERLVGSFNTESKAVVKPSLLGCSFATVTEHMTFLGTGEHFREKVDLMNRVLEGEYVDVQLVKLVQPSFPHKYLEGLAKQGLDYDPFNGRLRFKPEVSVIAASRPLDNKTYTYLATSGHIGRYHTIQFDISPHHQDLLMNSYKLDSEGLARLGKINADLATKRVTYLHELSPDMIQPLVALLISRAKQLNDGRKPLTAIVDMRIKGDVIREFVAHAFLRNPDIITYTNEDTNFIETRLDHFIEHKISPLVAEDRTDTREVKLVVAESTITSMLKSASCTRDTILTKLDEHGISRATTDRAINHLKQKAIIASKNGVYSLSSVNES